MHGISDIKFVNKVVLQNDICPHGRTYSVAMVRNIITTSTDHVCTRLYDPKQMFHRICVQLLTKNNEALLRVVSKNLWIF